MKLAALNQAQLNTIRYKAKGNSAPAVKVLSAKNCGIESVPYFVPVINFKGSLNENSNEICGINGTDPIPAQIPKEITEKGYQYYGKANLQDKDGNPASGHAFIFDEPPSKTPEDGIIHVLMTDEEFDDIGYIIADKREHNHVSVAINNYANVYREYRCDYDSPIKGYSYSKNRPKKEDRLYKKVGTELYRVLEEYLKKHSPEIIFIEACPVRDGSLQFHKKLGFRYSHSETREVYNGWDNPEVSYDYYIKSLR